MSHDLVIAEASAGPIPAVMQHPLIRKHALYLNLHEGRPAVAILDWTPLIPMDDLPALIKALEVAVRPATEKQIKEVLVILSSGWPSWLQKPEAGVMDAFVGLLLQEIKGFPGDILLTVMRSLLRTSHFAPSISDIYQPAEALVSERRTKLQIARDNLKEHERRAPIEARAKEQFEAEIQAVVTQLRDNPTWRMFLGMGLYYVGDEKINTRIADDVVTALMDRKLIRKEGGWHGAPWVMAETAP